MLRVPVCLYRIVHMSTSTHRSQQRAQGPLELESVPVCLCRSVHTQVPTEASREHRVPWNLSHK